MEFVMLILGIVNILLGIALRYWINRRRFNRTNMSGLQQYRNYEVATVTRFLERIGKILAYVLILAGIFFIWVYSSERKHRESKETIATEIHIPRK